MNVVDKLRSNEGTISMLLLLVFFGVLGGITIYLVTVPVLKNDIRITVRKAVDSACIMIEPNSDNEMVFNQSKGYNAFLKVLQTNLELDASNNPTNLNSYIKDQVTVDTFVFYDESTATFPRPNPLDSNEILTKPFIYAQVSIPYTFRALGKLVKNAESKGAVRKLTVSLVVAADELP